MKYITALLDDFARTRLDIYHHTFHGLSELVKRDDKVMPSTIPEHKQVALDDKVDMVTWMRVNGETTADASLIRGFGRSPKILQSVPIKWMFCHKASLGEQIVYDFVNQIPRQLKDPDKNFSVILLDETNRSVDSDHEKLYTEELGETAYHRHRLPWNVYAINLRVSFIPCT
jgi:hypothetical protein